VVIIQTVWAPMLVCLVALWGRIILAPTGGRSPIIRPPSPWLIHCTKQAIRFTKQAKDRRILVLYFVVVLRSSFEGNEVGVSAHTYWRIKCEL
jgi:hypothetical protein